MRATSLLFVSVFLFGVAARAQVQRITIGSAASGATSIAPDSLASIYGRNLTDQTQVAKTLPLPTSLAGIGVRVTDSAGTANLASLIFASPGQVNFVVPAGIATGSATIQVMSGANVVGQGSVQVLPTAPGLFAVDPSGGAAAYAVRTIAPSGPQTVFAAFQCTQGTCAPAPLNLGVDTPLYLELFGTGIRGSMNVTVTVNGQAVPVTYSGAQGQYPGLDQVNIGLVLNLRGSGHVPVVVTVDGQHSNAVFIQIQ
jgi:uncharacterized protein (TIGR03437 family)